MQTGDRIYKFRIFGLSLTHPPVLGKLCIEWPQRKLTESPINRFILASLRIAQSQYILQCFSECVRSVQSTNTEQYLCMELSCHRKKSRDCKLDEQLLQAEEAPQRAGVALD